jgi:hypothetical protein
VEVLGLHAVLPAGAVSAYDFRIPTADLIPSESEASRFVRDVEARHTDPGAVARAIDAWYVDTPFDAPVDSRHSPSTPS